MAQIKKINGETNTYVNKNMVVSIVSLATKEIQGVIDVYQPTKLSIKRLFNRNVGKGVRIKYTKLGILIDIYIIVDTECEVNDVVFKIQQNVKNSITSLLPIKIKAINVHIMDAEKKDSL
ncbi:MAG TPA: Asp23/Gls24 family envelope stress response protein [Candidatus Onthoplasma faecigallinarum]|nr:Asp23/Gls24 family envelope stress response protein [Candidatus Onthoplasma faecigallinarum]